MKRYHFKWHDRAIGLGWRQGIAIANNVFATADPLLKNACDYISMAESGKYYAFSAISEFQSIANGELMMRSYTILLVYIFSIDTRIITTVAY